VRLTEPAPSSPVPVSIHLPRTLFGAGTIAALREVLADADVRRPLIVTDRGIVGAGLVDRVGTAIGDRATPALFDGVMENPLFANADQGAAAYKASDCDGVIAVGGGSVIDVAKYIALLATHGGRTADYAGVEGARIGRLAPLFVIPTTAGTGSEANGTAGIHPDAASVAAGVFSHQVMPQLVILDPEMTLSLPPRLTAATGIDALSHCIEGYLSRNDAPFLNEIALDGARRAWANVRAATERGSDLSIRTEMLLAAYAGGVAITMGLGAAHAIAVGCGDQGYHHGVLSGIGLVAALDGIAEHRPERAEALRDALGLAPDASLSGAVAGLMEALGLPSSLRALGYRVDDIDRLAIEAHRSFFNLSAYHHPSAGEYRAMLQGSLA